LIRTDGSKKKRGRKILAVADGEEEEEVGAFFLIRNLGYVKY
jgi:hypothetical protein